jgi:PKHD-type hydroxylase
MQFPLEPLLSTEQVGRIRRLLLADDSLWRPGEETAGWHARTVKNNRQLDRSSPAHQALSEELVTELSRHPLIQAAAFPRRFHGVLFSRARDGEGYGRHVDNAWMAGGRSDISFTVFLSDPDDYQGGDLILESPAGEQRLRLPAGHAFLYPSTLLHRVEAVTAGERLVAVGWIESRIRHADQRELLFELDTARRALFQQEGKSEVFDLISRSYTNLLRRWDRS